MVLVQSNGFKQVFNLFGPVGIIFSQVVDINSFSHDIFTFIRGLSDA
jgi:hypothetical protein